MENLRNIPIMKTLRSRNSSGMETDYVYEITIDYSPILMEKYIKISSTHPESSKN